MNKFIRGTVVYHKAMGKGVAINETKEGLIEVRMENGQKEKFYPEELETEEEFINKNINQLPSDAEKWQIG